MVPNFVFFYKSQLLYQRLASPASDPKSLMEEDPLLTMREESKALKTELRAKKKLE